MDRYKSKFNEETPAAPVAGVDKPMAGSTKVAAPGTQAAGNAKDAVKDVKGTTAAEADLSNAPAKLLKTLVGKTLLSPKNKVALIFGADGIKIANIQTNKVLADLTFDDLKLKK